MRIIFEGQKFVTEIVSMLWTNNKTELESRTKMNVSFTIKKQISGSYCWAFSSMSKDKWQSLKPVKGNVSYECGDRDYNETLRKEGEL
jgi:hypothetical protein